MKKFIFTLLSITFLMSAGFAQSNYCGNSSASVCTPTPLPKPGLSPTSDSLTPVVNGVATNTIIYFKNFDTIRYQGALLTIQQLRIDSIRNLPSGLCWATNRTDNTFTNQGLGCIKVNGTPCGNTGQYKLEIWVGVDVGFGFLPYNADQVGLKYYVRLKNATDVDTPVDTTQTAVNPFIAYGGTCTTNGINEANSSINSLTVVPNPFNNKAVVSFFSAKGMEVTERLTNMLGAEVFKNNFEAKVGENASVVDRSNLPAGVYFYSLSNGKNVFAVRRVVIAD